MKLSFNSNLALNQFVAVGKKTANFKKDISEAVNDKSLEKMREIAYRDAQKGVCGSSEYISYLHECREKVAPNRTKIFAQAESKIKEIEKNPERDKTLWDYLLEHLGEPDDDCSVKAKHHADGWVNMTAYDENGETIGKYDPNNGWITTWNSTEETSMKLLSAEYGAAFKEYRQTMKNGDTMALENNSKLNISV